MADNPVKYADLLQPDDSITKAIGQLEKLQTTYTEMLAKVKEEALKLEVSIKKVSSATAEGQQKTKDAAADADRLAKAQKKITDAQSNTGIEIKKLQELQKEQNQISRLEIKLNKSKEGSYNRLSAQYSLNKIRLNKMSEAQREGTKAGRELEAETKRIYEEMNRLQKNTGKYVLQVGNYEIAAQKLNETLAKLEKREKEILATQGKTSQAYKLVRAEITQTKSKLAGLTAEQRKTNTGWQRFGQNIKSMIGMYFGIYALFRVIGDTIKRIKEFDDVMQNIAGILGEDRSQLRDVEKEIKNVAGSSKRTSNEVAKLAEVLFTLGKTKKEVILMLKPVNDLSIALQASSEDAADFLGSTLNAFGKGAESAQEFADIIANMRSSTALNFQRIKDSLQYIAPTAKTLGLTLGQTGAIIGTLVNNGVKAERAGSLLNTSFARLIGKGLTLNTALKKINESENKAATASNLFGKRAFGLGLILAANIKMTDNLAYSFDNLSGGSLKKLTDQQLKSITSQMKIADSVWEKFILRIDSGNGILSKFIKGVLSGFIGLLTPMETASEKFKSTNEQVANLNKNIAPLLDKYDQLKSKSKLTKTEQEQLKTVIQQIGTAIPTAITEWDKYGKALDISTDAGRRAIKVLERQNELLNADAIKEQQAQLDKYNARIDEINASLKSGTKNVVEYGGAFGSQIKTYELTDEQIVALQNELNNLQLNKEATQGIIDGLKGIKTQAEILADVITDDKTKVEDMASTMIGKGTPATEAHKKAINQLVERYQEMIKAGKGNTDQLNAQINALLALSLNYQTLTQDELDAAAAKAKQDKLDKAESKKTYLEQLIKLNKLQSAERIRQNEEIIKSDKYTSEQRLRALNENALLETNSIKAQTKIELDALSKRKELGAISDKQYQIEKKLIEAKSKDDILQVAEQLLQGKEDLDKKEMASHEKMLADKAKTSKQEYQNQIDAINQQADLKDSEIELLKTTEAEKTRLKLKAERDRLKAILELNLAGNKQLSDQEIETIKNTIEKLNGEIKSPKNQQFDLYSVAGIKLTDKKKQAINESVQFAIGQVNSFLQSKIEASQAAVDAANRESEASKSRLDAEIEARNNGYANQVDTAQKEYAFAKRNQEKALKEQEKAQKAQAAIETLQQTGSLITASAKIWEMLAFPWAIPAIAIMWGSFAAAKQKAASVTRQQTQSYGEGGLELLEGGSHSSGNDIPLGQTSDGKSRRAEGGEALAIINKRQTARYRRILPDVIDSLNRGIFERKYLNAFNPESLKVNVATDSPGNFNGLEKDVSEIRKQGERRYIDDGKGGIIEVYKNLKRYYNAN